MISINILNKSEFMNSLLAKDTFDYFLVSELEIVTANTFQINGRINKSFYEDEADTVIEDFTSWAALRHICFEIIKGKRTPSKIKITFQLPKSYIKKILTATDTTIEENQVSGMYMHVLFEKGELTIITGTSLNIFTMDKSLDKYWDSQISSLLNQHFNVETN